MFWNSLMNVFLDPNIQCATLCRCKYWSTLKTWAKISIIFFTAIKFSTCRFSRFPEKKYDIIEKSIKFSRKFTIWIMFFFMTIKFYSIYMNNHVYIRIFFHNADFFIYSIQSVFFLLFFAFIVFSPLRFIKFLADIDCANAPVDNFVHFFECITF